ncbi:unnamed protein product [Closterium sp. Naga37s-1]|nr:unnamed protein product [Closterium sp. Naga37s-1]
MPPKSSRAKAVVDAPAGGGDPASKSTPSKGKEVIDNLPSEAEVTAGSSGLTIEEKLQALATVASDDSFIGDDSDEGLEIDTSKSAHPHLRFTAVLLFPVIPSREVASMIPTVRMLMKRVWSNLLTDDFLASVKFKELSPAFVAKTRYSRLQVSFLHEFDAVKIKQRASLTRRLPLAAASLRASPLITPLLLDEAFVLISTGSNREEWLCTLESCGKTHGKSFMAAADHITSASHLLGLEKLGAATRSSLEKLGLHVIRKEYQI